MVVVKLGLASRDFKHVDGCISTERWSDRRRVCRVKFIEISFTHNFACWGKLQQRLVIERD